MRTFESSQSSALREMLFQQLTDGLYLVKHPIANKGFQHFGILDIGNRLRYPGIARGAEPVIIHQPPAGLRADWARATDAWQLVARITDESGARARVDVASKTPTYDLFGNNCEHFARFVATGKRDSPQLHKALGLAAGLAALTWMLGSE